MIIKLILKVV